MLKNMADDSTCILCATVTPGFESVAVSECQQKLHCNPVKKRGKVFCEIPIHSIHKAKELRSVENLYIVVREIEDYGISNNDDDKETTLEKLYQLANEVMWEEPVSIWQRYTGYQGLLVVAKNNQSDLSKDDDDDNQSDPSKDDDDDNDDERNQQSENVVKKTKTDVPDPTLLPSFRVTSTRTGSEHKFSSVEASAKFGGAINDLLHWRVDLSNADIEVLLNITNNNVIIGVALTRKSLGKRNIQHFGPTTLKSSLAYCLLQLAAIGPGDVVCDPMCGGGSIPIEAVLECRLSAHLCGDNHELAPSRALANLKSVCEEEKSTRSLPLEILQWDVTNLPLRTNCINAIITDMPFGKKSGTRQLNWTLYPKALLEMARVCSPSTGRAVILTHDKKVMKKTLQNSFDWWKTKLTVWINMGGLQAGVYVLTRTDKCFS